MFITFEGPEGSGKTTQIERAAAYLAKRGIAVTRTREPGGTEIADQIRDVLLRADNHDLVPVAELFLYFASRAQHVAEKIRPALQAGHVVLCDRYADSTLAYQGFARGLDIDLIHLLNDIATENLDPDLTLLFDLPVDVGIARARARAERFQPEAREDRFEQEELAFHEKLRRGFLQLAGQHPERYRVIDAARDVEEVWSQTKVTLDVALMQEGE
ncbi:MAG: dTMP kinase [Candidatus Lernaella stagnicola]|nr:dTMP kinase [Candidatus Lernaella stagnicola]